MLHTKFGLDPLHYYSLFGSSWDALLKYTDVELDLIIDVDMYQMVEDGMRGGISNISHYYARANHPRMETYNPNEEVKTLTYQDANALYSWAMSQLLQLKDGTRSGLIQKVLTFLQFLKTIESVIFLK